MQQARFRIKKISLLMLKNPRQRMAALSLQAALSALPRLWLRETSHRTMPLQIAVKLLAHFCPIQFVAASDDRAAATP